MKNSYAVPVINIMYMDSENISMANNNGLTASDYTAAQQTTGMMGDVLNNSSPVNITTVKVMNVIKLSR